MKKEWFFVFGFVVFSFVLVILFSPLASAEDWEIDLDVSYNQNSNRQPITVYDFDNDGYKEILVSHHPQVYLVGHDGTLLKDYSWIVPNVDNPPAVSRDADGRVFIAFTEGRRHMDYPSYFYLLKDVLKDEQLKTFAFDNERGYPLSPIIADFSPESPGLEILVYVNYMGDCGGEVCEDPPDKLYLFDSEGEVLPGWPKEVDELHTNNPVSYAVGDIDNDDILEIVIYTTVTTDLTRDGWILVYNQNGQFENKWVVDSVYAMQLSLADLNMNGFMEIILGTSSGQVLVYDFGGNLKDNWPYYSANDYIWSVPAVGNLDQDQDLEIVMYDWMYSWPTVFMTALNPDASLVEGEWPYVLESDYDVVGRMFAGSPAIGDIDGDGVADVLQMYVERVDWQDNVFLLILNIDGTVKDVWPLNPANEGLALFNLGNFLQTPVITDLDSDGDVEIVFLTVKNVNPPWTTLTLSVKDLDAPYNAETMHWPHPLHDPQNTRAHERYIITSDCKNTIEVDSKLLYVPGTSTYAEGVEIASTEGNYFFFRDQGIGAFDRFYVLGEDAYNMLGQKVYDAGLVFTIKDNEMVISETNNVEYVCSNPVAHITGWNVNFLDEYAIQTSGGQVTADIVMLRDMVNVNNQPEFEIPDDGSGHRAIAIVANDDSTIEAGSIIYNIWEPIVSISEYDYFTCVGCCKVPISINQPPLEATPHGWATTPRYAVFNALFISVLVILAVIAIIASIMRDVRSVRRGHKGKRR